GEYLLGGATSSSFPCSGQPYWVPVRKLRGPSGDCYARFCEGRGVKSPRLLGTSACGPRSDLIPGLGDKAGPPPH
ncbi:hypothetical protein ABTX79_35405, partial [Streptomyces sp. NPDC096153]